MAQIFPKWANKVPLYAVIILGIKVVVITLVIWYYFSPKFTDAGYRPIQPIAFSHKLHAGDLKLDCRYCHSNVEISPNANVPPVQTCMNCHKIVRLDSPKLEPVRESFKSNTPIEWVRVHNLPDYVYFNHSAHFNAGVGCQSCHGNIPEMEVVQQKESLSMSWCLDCHRNPDNQIRPKDKVTDFAWKPESDHSAFVTDFKNNHHINPPTTDCFGCHR